MEINEELLRVEYRNLVQIKNPFILSVINRFFFFPYCFFFFFQMDSVNCTDIGGPGDDNHFNINYLI